MPHESLNVVFLLCCWILLFCPQKNASFCGSTRTLTVDEGEDVILPSNPSPSLSYITWNFEKHIIAITGPGRPLQLGEYSYKYPGRLTSSRDGSLVITDLTAKDGQIYRADLFDGNRLYLCIQVYDLRIGERGGISPSVDSSESCSSTKQLFHVLGGNVVLRLPSHSRVAYVEWDVNNIDHIAITRPGGIIHRQNPNYHGKMSAMGDGSLKLSNLITEDQHVYRAEHFTDKWSHLCTQHYDVRVKSRSSYNNEPPSTPSISRTTSTSPTPGPYHSPGTIEELPGNPGLQMHIRLALSACILLATLSILLYHIKTEHSRTPK